MADVDDPMRVPRHYGYRLDYRIVQTGHLAVSAPSHLDAVDIARQLLGITSTEQFEIVDIADVD